MSNASALSQEIMFQVTVSWLKLKQPRWKWCLGKKKHIKELSLTLFLRISVGIHPTTVQKLCSIHPNEPQWLPFFYFLTCWYTSSRVQPGLHSSVCHAHFGVHQTVMLTLRLIHNLAYDLWLWLLRLPLICSVFWLTAGCGACSSFWFWFQ